MEQKKQVRHSILPKSKRVRALILVLLDALVLTLSSYLGLFIRFDFKHTNIPLRYWQHALTYLPYYIVAGLVIFWAFRLYKFMWTVAGIKEAATIVLACILSTLFQIAGMTFFTLTMPRSYYLISFVILTAFMLLLRLSWRIYKVLVKDRLKAKNLTKIIIYGAGEAGAAILKELQSSSLAGGRVLCFLDDNPNKKGKVLNGVDIVGDRSVLLKTLERYQPDCLYIAMPSATAQQRKAIIEIAQQTSVQIKVLPGLYELINGKVDISQMRDVNIEDLLGREPIKTNLEEVAAYLANKVVLVTGGGGSIGSELCRQIVAQKPKLLVVLDSYENNIYTLQQELKMSHMDANTKYLIASVQNEKRIDSIFEEYRPDIVFHAAAHKHVPLMEESPNEAIKNNVFGTLKTAKAADKYGAERFVLISTDKAVNPTNVMGASKRICEMIVQLMSHISDCNFVAVRFGNVLGSNGSVIPLFREQIKKGGPVTVTHPDIIRYFMTISEAVSLVLQAGAYASGGEIFVLDMGSPVKIVDLAKNLIRLSGYEPNVDIPIEFTGLRPGEKLYEELLMGEEGLTTTPNKVIFIGKPIELDEAVFSEQLLCLKEMADNNSPDIRVEIKKIVKTYHESEV